MFTMSTMFTIGPSCAHSTAKDSASAVQTYNQTYGNSWLTPTLVLPARFAKISAQFDF
jgi:hypothetical protein